MNGLPYIAPTRIDSPAVGCLHAARDGKKRAAAYLRALRRELKSAPMGKRSEMRLSVMRAEDSHRQWLRMESDALAALEARARELGKTTIRARCQPLPDHLPSDMGTPTIGEES